MCILETQAFIKLSELTQRIKDVINLQFGEQSFWVLAEVSGHKFYPNPERHYFEFLEKDEASKQPIAKVRAVAWSGGSERIRVFEKETGQQFGNGMQVLTLLRVEFNAAFGFQLIILDIDPTYTIGKIEQQKRDTLERLLRENPDKVSRVGDDYITFNKRQALKAVLQHIALVGSPNSEGFSDFCHTLQTNRFGYGFQLDVFQSAVQGEGADREIKNKLIQIFESGRKYDVVVIIRGGGSKSDLLTFDAYGLAQTVARFPIPIVTGLGHHNDVSITDLMAHTATKTPTKAAEFIVSHNRAFEEALVYLQQGIVIKSQQLLAQHNKRISQAREAVVNQSRNLLINYQRSLMAFTTQLSSKPSILINHKLNDMLHLQANLKSHVNKLLLWHKGTLNHYASVVKIMSPENILKKGFAILSVQGKIVTDVKGLEKGNVLMVLMEKHQIETIIESIKENNGTKS
ncbi:MAG: exodeoxyribonuclease VII large subunit [bacterium]|nr:exodeoxyribonuclease VII large subunit [bacterium]